MAMDFFEAQDRARGRSHKLVALFLLAVALIIGVIYTVVHLAVWPGPGAPFEPKLLATVTAAVALVVGGGTGWRVLGLRQGGSHVARMLGGRRVEPDTRDPDERRLLNVVEEMAIASGVPVPAVFVLEHEEAINAFAAGYTIHDAAVAVTRGTLRHLDRDELQGVIAHEFSHILNGDMRLNIHLIGLLHGLLLLAVIGRGLARGGARVSSSRRRSGDARVALVGVVLLILGYIGVFFGQIIKAAVSRQREFLADAAAVQFTRNPAGIAGALKKIGGLSHGSRLRHHQTEEVSHLLFAGGLGSFLEGLFATHPPLVERIRRLDPRFDGRFQPIGKDTPAHSLEATSSTPPSPGTAGFDDPATRTGAIASAGAAPDPAAATRRAGTSAQSATAPDAAALVASIGAPEPEHLDHAIRLLDSMPAPLREAAHSPELAPALVFALLLDAPDSTALPAQRAAIRNFGGADLLARTESLAPLVRTQGPHARLPLLDIVLPALRSMPAEHVAPFGHAVRDLIRADGSVRPFEYALFRVLRRNLVDATTRPGARQRTVRSMDGMRAEAEIVLSMLARAGAGDDVAVRAAFAAAGRALPASVGRLRLRDAVETDLSAVEHALGRLALGSAGVRHRFLQACAACITWDGVATPVEVEWFRAIAEALDCPVPPSLAVPTPAVP